MKKKRDEEEEYCLSDPSPIIAEMKRLEMQILLYESDEAFRMMVQQEKEAGEDFGSWPGLGNGPL